MFYNLKIAFRNLQRSGLYSAINITGLTVSLTVCILMSLWVYDEWSFDRFHKKKDSLYLVNFSLELNNFINISPAGLAVYAKEEIAEIKDFCRISTMLFSHFAYNGRHILLDNSINHGAAVDSTFFKLFTFPFVEGDAQHKKCNRQQIKIGTRNKRGMGL